MHSPPCLLVKTSCYVAGDIIGVGLAAKFNNYITGRGLLASPDYTCNNALFSFAMNFYSLQTARTLSSMSAQQIDAVIASLNLGIT